MRISYWRRFNELLMIEPKWLKAAERKQRFEAKRRARRKKGRARW